MTNEEQSPQENRVNQTNIILGHLKAYGSIEPLTAFRDYGVYRLGARIADLRRQGYNIITERRSRISKYTNRKVYYANYLLLQ